MPALRALLYVALAGSGLLFAAFTYLKERARPPRDQTGGRPRAREVAVGFVTDFFDTLGIGSFAPTTALFRLFRLVPDELIPGTLMVGHALPTIVQAIIYITVIEVDATTLTLLIAASVLGSVLGASFVARLPRRAIQLGMGLALLVASAVFVGRLLGSFPAGGQALALGGVPLAIGLVGNFVLGVLMTIGIGSYAPSLILFALLGLNTQAIFPVMMGSCALIMPSGGVEFVRRQAYSRRVALALTVGGIPGVLVAAFIVRSLPLRTLSWMVVIVVVYTAVSMLLAGLRRPGNIAETAKGDR